MTTFQEFAETNKYKEHPNEGVFYELKTLFNESTNEKCPYVRLKLEGAHYTDNIVEGQISGRLGIGSITRSRKIEWDRDYRDTNKVTLVLSDIGEHKYRLYKAINTYYLTNASNEYQGYIQLKNIKGRVYQINESSSNLSGGFYKIMFPLLLSQNIDEILSDNDLSDNALKSYSNLLNTSLISIQIYKPSTQSYIEFNKDNFLENIQNVISITKKHKDYDIKEHFNKYNSLGDNRLFGQEFWQYLEY